MAEAATDRPHVVVIGAGFAGLGTVGALRKAPVRVTLVDTHPYTTFQPLLYQVATGGLNPGDITYPIRALTRKYPHLRFLRATMTGIDLDARTVELAGGGRLGYDYLVLGLGAMTNYFGVEGANEYAFPIYTRADALAVRSALGNGLEKVAARDDPAARRYTVVIVGGGATGVEMAGALAELRTGVIRLAYPEIDPEDVHVELVEMGDELLAPFVPKLRAYAAKALREREVSLRFGATVQRVTADTVVLAGGEQIPADLVVWAAGVRAPDGAGDWGLDQGRSGRLVVEPDLRVSGRREVYVTGDLSVIKDDTLPQVAQVAIQTGRHAGHQIVRSIAGEPMQEFRYRDKGIMATIGRRAAVVQFPHGRTLRGTIAWFAWVGLHIYELIGSRNRVSTLLNLAWRYVGWPRNANMIVGD